MMKKLLICLIAGAMVLSAAACADKNGTNDGEQNDSQVENEAGDETENENQEPTPGENTDGDENADADAGTDIETPAADTVGGAIAAIFHEQAADAESAEALANAILENYELPFMAEAFTIEEGLLPGFDNTEITGFADGARFGPMIGSTPFVGYVFFLDEDADLDAFKTLLADNANPRWQICVAAKQTVLETEGNKVLLLMCPLNFSDNE